MKAQLIKLLEAENKYLSDTFNFHSSVQHALTWIANQKKIEQLRKELADERTQY
jgi:hypothetical protein